MWVAGTDKNGTVPAVHGLHSGITMAALSLAVGILVLVAVRLTTCKEAWYAGTVFIKQGITSCNTAKSPFLNGLANKLQFVPCTPCPGGAWDSGPSVLGCDF